MTVRKCEDAGKGKHYISLCVEVILEEAEYVMTARTEDFRHTSSRIARVLWDQGSQENICT